MALKIYGNYPLGLQSNVAARRVDLLSDTIRVSLHTSTYVFNQDTHVFFSDATNELPSGSGYTAGGITLTSKTLTYDGSFNGPIFDAADVSWPTATFTARHAIIHKWTGSAATSPLIACYDFTSDAVPGGQTFQITWNPSGIFVAGAQ